MDIPKFPTQKALFDHLVANEKVLVAEKKAQNKFTDSLKYIEVIDDVEGDVVKAVASSTKELEITGDTMEATLVINTTNILDSHGDVHIDGIWTKTLSESRDLYLLREHQLKFEGVISDEVKASAKRMAWKDLGFPFEGNTQALIFKAIIRKKRNEYMFDQYASRYVKNHSVGMQYVKMYLCINDENYSEHKAMWDKYIGKVVNPEAAEARGYFWAVTEAKLVEGSAVLVGSNYATPVIGLTDTNKDNEPSNDTQEADKTEPPVSTQKRKSTQLFIN
jgi:hypothetical protein